MAARPRGHQHRRQKSATHREDRQRLGILQHCEYRGRSHQSDQRGERCGHRQHFIQAGRRENRQVQQANTGALQYQPVGVRAMAQLPTRNGKHDATQGRANESQLDRHQGIVIRIAQQKRDPEEQHDHANPDHQIAGGEESLYQRQQVGQALLEGRGLGAWPLGLGPLEASVGVGAEVGVGLGRGLRRGSPQGPVVHGRFARNGRNVCRARRLRAGRECIHPKAKLRKFATLDPADRERSSDQGSEEKSFVSVRHQTEQRNSDGQQIGHQASLLVSLRRRPG